MSGADFFAKIWIGIRITLPKSIDRHGKVGKRQPTAESEEKIGQCDHGLRLIVLKVRICRSCLTHPSFVVSAADDMRRTVSGL